MCGMYLNCKKRSKEGAREGGHSEDLQIGLGPPTDLSSRGLLR